LLSGMKEAIEERYPGAGIGLDSVIPIARCEHCGFEAYHKLPKGHVSACPGAKAEYEKARKEVITIAIDVINGKTRSYVADAMVLAKFIKRYEP